MKPISVLKFGGTSMGTPAAMFRAAKIVNSCEAARVVVVSATSGTTNQLIQVYESKISGLNSKADEIFEAIRFKHREMALGLEMNDAKLAELEDLLSQLKSTYNTLIKESVQDLDELLSYGERLSSLLFAQALHCESQKPVYVLDARHLLRTNSRHGKAEPLQTETKQCCEATLNLLQKSNDLFVTQGFIGADHHGKTTTLGRGGSDYSAALFAEAFQANEVQIWTDVPGILTMDPNVVPEAKVIPEISFAEAAEMANFGAKVLHPATLVPAMRSNIPVFVGSTFLPHQKGTRITPEPKSELPLIRAIAVRKRQTLITVSSPRMLNAHGFLAKMFEVLARHHLSIDLVTTSEVSVALTIDETALGSSGKSIVQNHELLDELRSFAEVSVEENLSLIALIGNSLNRVSGVAAKVFQSVSDFNLRLICHGASEHNICFLISSEHASDAAKRLHHICIEEANHA